MGQKRRQTLHNRERRKKAEKTRRLKSKQHPKTLALAPGVTARLSGRRIRFENNQTPAQRAASIEDRRARVAELPEAIDSLIGELRRLLKPLPTLQLWSALTLAVVAHDPETYSETTSRPLIELEYPTWLGLLEPTPTDSSDVIDGTQIEEVLEKTKAIIDLVFMYIIHERAPVDSGVEPVAYEISGRTRTYELAVRNPGYSHHHQQMLIKLFSRFDQECDDLLGFTISDAITMTNTIGEIFEPRLDARRREAHESVDILLDQVSKYQKDRIVDSQIPLEVIEELSRLNRPDRKARARSISMAWFVFGFQELFTVATVEIAEICGLSESTTAAFLETFSLPFGQPPIPGNWPSRYEPLELAPLVRLPEGKFFAHLITKLNWSIKDQFELALKGRPGVWERYQHHRSTVVEIETLELLRNCLPGAEVYHDLNYTVNSPDGEPINFQLDGLIVYDTVLFLVEAKAGAMRWSARRGAPISLREDLQKMVGEAHEQAIRASAFIDSEPEVSFKIQDGGNLSIAGSSFSQRIIVTSTLDELSVFTTRLAELAGLGIMSDGPLPWAVSLPDLRVISELIDYGPQLVHFLRCRASLNQLPISAPDELDYFSHYLKFGLKFEMELEGNSVGASILSHTGDFDDYYLHEMGIRKTPAEKPQQALTDSIREQIATICHEQPAGFVDDACRLLDQWRNDIESV